MITEAKRILIETERDLHKADFEYGLPLPLMDGYSISFHAPDCPRCSFLAQQAIAGEREAKEERKAKESS